MTRRIWRAKASAGAVAILASALVGIGATPASAASTADCRSAVRTAENGQPWPGVEGFGCAFGEGGSPITVNIKDLLVHERTCTPYRSCTSRDKHKYNVRVVCQSRNGDAGRTWFDGCGRAS